MRYLTELRKHGYLGTILRFDLLLEQIRAEHFNSNRKDIVCHPYKSLQFCILVRMKLKLYSLPYELILKRFIKR